MQTHHLFFELNSMVLSMLNDYAIMVLDVLIFKTKEILCNPEISKSH